MKIPVQDVAVKILKKNTSAEYWEPNYSHVREKCEMNLGLTFIFVDNFSSIE